MLNVTMWLAWMTLRPINYRPEHFFHNGDYPFGRRFQNQGLTTGDRINLSMIDANAQVAGDQAFVFGAAKTVGRVWLAEPERPRKFVPTRILARLSSSS